MCMFMDFMQTVSQQEGNEKGFDLFCVSTSDYFVFEERSLDTHARDRNTGYLKLDPLQMEEMLQTCRVYLRNRKRVL